MTTTAWSAYVYTAYAEEIQLGSKLETKLQKLLILSGKIKRAVDYLWDCDCDEAIIKALVSAAVSTHWFWGTDTSDRAVGMSCSCWGALCLGSTTTGSCWAAIGALISQKTGCDSPRQGVCAGYHWYMPVSQSVTNRPGGWLADR